MSRGFRCPIRRNPCAMARNRPQPAPILDARTPSENPLWREAVYELWYKGKLVKHLDRRAIYEAIVCRAFEAKAWAHQIADPLPLTRGIDPKQRLHDALKKLNRGQKLIHFGGDGSGRGVIWL